MAWHRHRSSQDQLKFTVYMNEGERHQIEEWVEKYDDIETGGDLFGAWIDEHTAVVQFVLGPGVQCRRTSVSFYQDINYLRDAGGYLTQKHGLCNIGQWHSHHRLGLTQPSGGDKNTVWGNMPSLGLKRYIVFIATITGGNRSYNNYSTSSYHDREDLKVNINPYLFEIKNGYRNDVPLGTIELLPGNSPFRLDGRIQNAIRIRAESTNEIKKFPQKRQHDHVAGDERLKIPKAEAKTPGNSGDADKSGQEYAATAIYAIKEQGEQVNVPREEDEEDEKPNNNLKDRQENSQPPAKEIHKNIGEKHITDVHQEKKNEQQNNQKGDGVNSEQRALKAGTESEQQTSAGTIIQNDNNMFKTDGEANKTHFESNDGPTGPDTMATDDKKPGKRKNNHETALIGEESVGPKEKDEEQHSKKSDDTPVEESSDPNDENNKSSTTTRDVNPTLDGSENLGEESTNTFSTAAEQDGDSDGIHGDEMDVDNDSHHSKNDNEPEKIKNDKTELTGEEDDEEPNNNLKDRQENSQPPAKEIHKNIGEDEKHITDVHQEKKNEQQNNQKGDGVNSEQQALKAGTESEQQTSARTIIQNDNNMFKTDGEANKTHFESNDGPTSPDTMATDDKEPGKTKNNHETALIGEESVGRKEKDEEQQSEKSDTPVEESSDPNDENNKSSTTTRDVNPTLDGSDNLGEESTNTFSTAAEQDGDSDGIHGDEMDVDNDSHHSKNDNEPEKIKNEKTELTGEESVGLKGNDEEQPSGESDTRVEESSDPSDENNETSTTTRDVNPTLDGSDNLGEESTNTFSTAAEQDGDSDGIHGDEIDVDNDSHHSKNDNEPEKIKNDKTELTGEESVGLKRNDEEQPSGESDTRVEESSDPNDENNETSTTTRDVNSTLDGSDNLCEESTNTFSTAAEQDGDSDGIHGDEMDVDNDSHHSKNDNEPGKIKNDKTELTGEESVGLKGNDEEQPSGESDTRVEECFDPNDENNESSTTTRDTPIEDSHEEEDDSNVTQSEDTVSNNENSSAKGDAVNLQGKTFQNDSESIDFNKGGENTKGKDAGELKREDMKNKNQNAEMTTSERTPVNELNQTQAKTEGDLKMTLDGSKNLCVQDTQHQCQNTFSTAVEQEGDSGTADIEVSEQLKAQEPPKENNRGDIVEQREETELGLKKGSKADNAEKTIMTGQTDDKKVSSLVVTPGEDGQNEKKTEKPGNKENGKSDEKFMIGAEDSSKVISKPSIPSPMSQGNGLIGIATGDSANKYTQPSTINPNILDTQSTNEKHLNKRYNRKSRSIFDPSIVVAYSKEQELESKNVTSTSDTMTIADDQALTAKEVESKRMDAKDEEIDVPKTTEATSSIQGPDPECGEKSKNGNEKQDFKKLIKMESKNKDIENKKGDGDETIERIDPEEKERAINTNQNDEDVDASEQTASESQNPKKKRKLSKILKKPFERKSKKKDGENKSGKNETTERSNTEKKKRSINRSQINQDVDASEQSTSKPQNPKSLESKNEGIENKSDKNKTIERSDPDEKERIIIISENDQDVDASELSASESQNPKKKRKWSKIFKKPFERKSKEKDGENKSGKNETIERSDPDEKERVIKISQNDQDVDASELSASESQNPQNPFGRKSKDKKNKKAGCFPF